MLELIEELLDMNVIESGHLRVETAPLSLLDVLEEGIESVGHTAEDKAIRIGLEIPPTPIRVVADAHRICQVLTNLISNAVKYSHPGTGTTVRAPVEGRSARIAVMDQGRGIPGDEVESLVTEFGRTNVKPTGGERSTGLGLAIVKRIAEAPGGEVSVESTVGTGSTFASTLPLAG